MGKEVKIELLDGMFEVLMSINGNKWKKIYLHKGIEKPLGVLNCCKCISFKDVTKKGLIEEKTE